MANPRMKSCAKSWSRGRKQGAQYRTHMKRCLRRGRLDKRIAKIKSRSGYGHGFTPQSCRRIWKLGKHGHTLKQYHRFMKRCRRAA